MFVAALVLAAVHLPTAVVGTEYDSGPIAPAAVLGCKRAALYYRLVEGEMPDGLQLRPLGALSGQPRHAGDYQIIVEIDNGCIRTLVPVQVSVRGRAILASFETEVELSEDKPEVVVRVYADRPGLIYSADPSEPWIRVRPLRGRLPLPGEALSADLVTITLDRDRLQAAANPDGPAVAKVGIVRLSCFRCRGTSIRVLLK